MTEFDAINVATPAGNASGFLGEPDQTSGGNDVTVTIPDAPPAPSFLAIESDFTQAYSTTEFAAAHATAADNYIAQLGALAGALVPPTINPVFPQNLNPPALIPSDPPELLPIDIEQVQVPKPFAGSLAINFDFPTFDAQPPQLLFPAAPTMQVTSLPASPSVDLNYTYPDVDVTLPDAPDLISIDVRPFDGVTFPVFDATAPVLTLAAPQIVDYLPNAPYTDALLSGLTGTLLARLELGNTGTNTGLPAAIEDNIWNRGREREYRQLADNLSSLDRMEAMGYAFPPGAFVDAQIKLRTDFQYTVAGQSRDVATEQAKLEQSNIQKAMELSVSIESKLIDYANQTEQRRFDACRYATEAGVSIYNAQVQSFGMRVQLYRAQIEVYQGQIAGARGIIEAYTAEIAAEKLKLDANATLIQEYKVQVDAAVASIEVFKGEISILQTRAQIENLKVSIYGEQVKAYAAEVNVFTSQVEAYRSQIQAEQAKEGIYSTQAQVYGTLVDATAKGINSQIEVFKAELAAKQEEYDAYKAQVGAQSDTVRAIAAANSAIADVYKAEVQGVGTYNESLVKEWESMMQISTQITQIGVSAAQANGQLYLTAKGIATDAAKVGAQVEAQIAASALGAVTFATHRSRQDSVGFSTNVGFGHNKSISQSSSTSYGSNNNTTVSTNTSSSVSASTSVSNSTVKQTNSVE